MTVEGAVDKVFKENKHDVSMGTFKHCSVWKQKIRNKRLIFNLVFPLGAGRGQKAGQYGNWLNELCFPVGPENFYR